MAYCVRFWTCRKAIIEDVRPQDVLPYFLQEVVISQEEAEIIMHEITTRGRTVVMFRFLLEKLERNGDVVFPLITWALRETYPHLADLLEEKIEGAMEADYVEEIRRFLQNPNKAYDVVTEDRCTVETVAKELRNYYEHTYQLVTPVPWNEAFQVHIESVCSNLLFVSIKEAKLRSSKSLQEMARNTNEDGIEIEEIFELQTRGKAPSHILIEGEQGMGKSTLCKKLAFSWACGATDNALFRNFDLVFMVEARHLGRKLLDAIYEEGLPERFVVSKTRLREVLEKPSIQERVLFIVDAYDELSAPSSELRKLLKRRIYSRCSLLVTSRPSYADDIIKYFDTGYVILGLPYTRRKECIYKYTQESRLSMELFRGLENSLLENTEIAELSKTPLYLWFLCMLLEDSGDKLPETRTALYQEVVDFLLRRLEWHSELTPTAIAIFMDNICKLAYKGIDEARINFDDETVNDLISGEHAMFLQRTFLSRVTPRSRLRPRVQHVFTHKSIQEFLAAIHLRCLEPTDRMQLIRLHKNQRKWNMVLIFLCGLLSGDQGELDDLYTSAICRELCMCVCDLASVPKDEHDHGMFHLGLQCLAESGIFPSFHKRAEQIVPRSFVYRVMTCHFCLNGFVIAHRQGSLGHCPDLVLEGMDLETHQMFDYRLLEAVSEINSLPSLVFSEVLSINMLIEYLTKFATARSDLTHLYIDLSPFMHHETTDCGFDATHLRSLHTSLFSLKSFVFSGSVSRLYKGAELIASGIELLLDAIWWNLGASLHTLAITDHSIVQDNIPSLLNGLYKCANLRKLIFERTSFNHEAFSRMCLVVAEMETLTCLRLDHCVIDATVDSGVPSKRLMRVFRKLQQIDTISLQGLQRTGFDFKELVNGFLENRSLSSIDLSENDLPPVAREALFQALPSLTQLEHLALRAMKGRFVYSELLTTLRALKSLKSLDLSGNNLSQDEVIKELCSVLTSLPNLTSVALNTCHLLDYHLCDLALLFHSGHVSRIYLSGNYIGVSDIALNRLFRIIQESETLRSLHMSLYKVDKTTPLRMCEALSSQRHLEEVSISSHPSEDLLSRDAFNSVFQAFRERLPCLASFSLRFSTDIQGSAACHVTNHEKWRDICLNGD